MFARKDRKKPKQPALDPGFVPAAGLPYLDFLAILHQALEPDWYLEIGTRKGKSLARARGKTIAIDPQFRLAAEAIGAPPEVHLFKTTSDAFFAGPFLDRNGIRIAFAFLDGLHLFEFLLRDFMNCERFAAAGVVLAIHDCMPLNLAMTDREWDPQTRTQWTGDVWKILPILRDHRPDLSVRIMDCPATGLVRVSGLDPSRTELAEAYDGIVARYSGMTLADYGVERFFAEFRFSDSHAAAARVAAGAGREGLGAVTLPGRVEAARPPVSAAPAGVVRGG